MWVLKREHLIGTAQGKQGCSLVVIMIECLSLQVCLFILQQQPYDCLGFVAG